MNNILLSMSRINRLFRNNGLDFMPSDAENTLLATIMLEKEHEELFDAIYGIIKKNIDLEQDKIITISNLFEEVKEQMIQYVNEIESRKSFVRDELKIWKESNDVIKDEKFYGIDIYLSCYKNLAENNINSDNLNLYEAFILSEEIQCQFLAKAIYEMMSIIEDKNKTFCGIIKEYIKHANFYVFMLDIYNDVEKMYNEYIEKERHK